MNSDGDDRKRRKLVDDAHAERRYESSREPPRHDRRERDDRYDDSSRRYDERSSRDRYEDDRDRKRKGRDDRDDRGHRDNWGRDRRRSPSPVDSWPPPFIRRALEGPFKSLKQFSDLCTDLQPADIAIAYEDYKKEFNAMHSREFFDMHKNDAWFAEKYNPKSIEEWWPARCEKSRAAAEAFFARFNAGEKFDLFVDHNEHLLIPAVPKETKETKEQREARIAEEKKAAETNASAALTADAVGDQTSTDNQPPQPTEEPIATAPSEGEQAEATTGAADTTTSEATPEAEPGETPATAVKPPKQPKPEPTPSNVLFIKTITPKCTRAELEQVLSTAAPFRRLIISEANPLKGFHRIGWVEYASIEDAQASIKALAGHKMKGFDLQIGMHRPRPGGDVFRKVKKTPALFSMPSRLRKDLELAARLASVLDREKGITNNPVLYNMTNLDEMRDEDISARFDAIVSYLRQVHFYVYHKGLEFATEDSMVMLAGEITLRGSDKLHSKKDPTQWAKETDERNKHRASHPFDIEVASGKRGMEKIVDEEYTSHVSQLDDNKFKCDRPACGKLFRGLEFIKKHLFNRHGDQFADRAMDMQYYANYLADSQRITPSFVGVGLTLTGGGSNSQKSANKDNGQGAGSGSNRKKKRDRRGGGGGGGGSGGGGPNQRSPNGQGRGFGTPMPPSGRSRLSYVDLDQPQGPKVELDYTRRLQMFMDKKTDTPTKPE